MSSLLAKLTLSLLGVGGITTVVAVPTVLANKGSGDNKELDSPQAGKKEEKEEKTKHTNPHTPHTQWKNPTDFHKYCYGDFLKDESKGELLVCEDLSEDGVKSNPLFYLRWNEKGTENFWPIQKIYVNSSGETGKKWEVNFYTGSERKSKQLVVIEKENNHLVVLHVESPDVLQKNCKGSKKQGDDYLVKCTFLNEKYEKLAKKEWFKDS